MPSRSAIARRRASSARDVGRLWRAGLRLLSVRVDLHDQLVGGQRGAGDHVFGAHQPGAVLAQAGEQTLALIPGVAVGLVQREQQRALRFAQCGECAKFALRHVAVDDEDDQIADRGDIEGKALAFLAGQLVDARRVDQVQALAADFLPALRVARARRAVQHAGGERVAAEQRIAECGFADADAAEHGDMQLAGRQLVEQGFDLGEVLGQLAAHALGYTFIVEQRAQRFAGLRDMRVGRRTGGFGERCAAEARAQLVPPLVGAHWLAVVRSGADRLPYLLVSAKCPCTGTSAPISAQSALTPRPKSWRLSVVSTSSVALSPCAANCTFSVTGLL